jgi:hypothetical protein
VLETFAVQISRYTEPEPELALLLDQRRLDLPPQPLIGEVRYGHNNRDQAVRPNHRRWSICDQRGRDPAIGARPRGCASEGCVKTADLPSRCPFPWNRDMP